MSRLFDAYSRNYREVVEESVSFSGKDHDFFLRAKARVFSDYLQERARLRGVARADIPLAALDVGCGTGELHRHVRPLFDRLVGVDVSSESIARARLGKAGADDYQVYDGMKLPFADDTFDFTFTVCVMHHVPVSQWQAFVREMARVTRPGGSVAIIEHNPYNPLTRLAVARCPFDRDAVLLARRRVRALLADAGLENHRGWYFLFVPSEARLALMLERGLRHLPLGGQYAHFATV